MSILLNSVPLQELDDNGSPLSGAKLFTYLAGTTTPVSVYVDVDLTTPATNPVIADASGRFVPLWVDETVEYKYVLTDANDVEIWTQDNVNKAGAVSTTETLIFSKNFDEAGNTDTDTLNSAVSAAATAGTDDVFVNADLAVDGASVNPDTRLIGEGKVADSSTYLRKDVARPYTVPFTPQNVTLKIDKENPVIVLVGDSISTYVANNQGRGDMLNGMLRQRVRELLGDGNFTFYVRAYGGQKLSKVLAAAPGAGNEPDIDWWTDGTRTWANYIEDLNPDVIITSFGMNDADTISYQSDIIPYENWANALPTSPKLVFCTNVIPTLNPSDPANGDEDDYESRDMAAGMLRSFCQARGYHLIDNNRAFTAARDGFDVYDSAIKNTQDSITENSQTWTGSEACYNFLCRLDLNPDNFTTDENNDVVRLELGRGANDWLRISRTSGGNMRFRISTDPAGSAYNYINDSNVTAWPTGTSYELIIEVNRNLLTVYQANSGNGFGQYVEPIYQVPLVRYGGLKVPEVVEVSDFGGVNSVTFQYGERRKYIPWLRDSELYGDGEFDGSSFNHPGNKTSEIYGLVLSSFDIQAQTPTKTSYMGLSDVVFSPTVTAFDTSTLTLGEGNAWVIPLADAQDKSVVFVARKAIEANSLRLYYLENSSATAGAVTYAIQHTSYSSGSAPTPAQIAAGTPTLNFAVDGQLSTFDIAFGSTASVLEGDEVVFFRRGTNGADTHDADLRLLAVELIA